VLSHALERKKHARTEILTGEGKEKKRISKKEDDSREEGATYKEGKMKCPYP